MKTRLPFAAALLAAATLASAHPHHDHPHGSDPAAAPPPAAKTARAVKVEMGDSGCSIREITAARGESIRLVATNKSSRSRDLAVGSAADLKGQAEMIRKFPQMQAAKSSRITVKPGETAELVWSAGADAVVACDAAGEFDAQKAAKVTLTAR